MFQKTWKVWPPGGHTLFGSGRFASGRFASGRFASVFYRGNWREEVAQTKNGADIRHIFAECAVIGPLSPVDSAVMGSRPRSRRCLPMCRCSCGVQPCPHYYSR